MTTASDRTKLTCKSQARPRTGHRCRMHGTSPGSILRYQHPTVRIDNLRVIVVDGRRVHGHLYLKAEEAAPTLSEKRTCLSRIRRDGGVVYVYAYRRVAWQGEKKGSLFVVGQGRH